MLGFARSPSLVSLALVLAACSSSSSGNGSDEPGDGSVRGTVRGPAGTTVKLQLDGGESLEVAIPASTTAKYEVAEFQFTTALEDGASYAIQVQAAPSGQTCKVLENGSGTAPASAAALIGCEWTYDLVSRDGTDRLASGNRTVEVVTGGTGVDEGRYVAFQYGDGDEGFAGSQVGSGFGFRQIYWRDRMTGETLLISANAAGAEGNQDSSEIAMSADGLTVAFTSLAKNLDPADSNDVADIYVWRNAERAKGATLATRVGQSGAISDGASGFASLSGDGSVIAFHSYASNLTGDKAALGRADIETSVFRKDLGSGETTILSRSVTNKATGGRHASISEDGQRVAFYNFDGFSDDSRIVADDDDRLWDIYVYDRASGASKRVSLTSTGASREQGDESASRIVIPTLSGDGKWLVYSTTAGNVVPGDTNDKQDIFRVEVDTGAVTRVSVAGATQGSADSPTDQGGRVAISYDGRYVAYNTSAENLATTPGGEPANVVLVDTQTGESRGIAKALSANASMSLSRTGAYLAFAYGNALDARFPQAGTTVHFTSLGNAFFWKR